MGMEHVKGLLEETFELRWEREERAKCAKCRWTESTDGTAQMAVCRGTRGHKASCRVNTQVEVCAAEER